jgi:hypothetical protein
MANLKVKLMGVGESQWQIIRREEESLKEELEGFPRN